MKTPGMDRFSNRLDEIFEQGMITKAQILDAYNKFAQQLPSKQRIWSDEFIEDWLQERIETCGKPDSVPSVPEDVVKDQYGYPLTTANNKVTPDSVPNDDKHYCCICQEITTHEYGICVKCRTISGSVSEDEPEDRLVNEILWILERNIQDSADGVSFNMNLSALEISKLLKSKSNPSKEEQAMYPEECVHPYSSVLGDGEMQPAKCLKCGKIL